MLSNIKQKDRKKKKSQQQLHKNRNFIFAVWVLGEVIV